MAAGLLQEESAGDVSDPIEQLIFSPGNSKLDQTNYFKILKTSD